MSQTLCLKTIFDLRLDISDKPTRYYIPAYQRGYRWTATQVTQLLEDLREFTKRVNPQQEEFYCLQPLVLRPNDDGAYEVVDGQQRLTTLLLILRHFNERLSARYQLKLYKLEYETRPDLQSFLDNPSPEAAASNIDFFHIDQAMKTISGWFEERESEVEDIKGGFLNKTKIIWFELSPGENAVAAFTRLNVGKIPLTNGELIRALFLKRERGESARKLELQLRIAQEWDAVEKSLQEEDFWSFLSNTSQKHGSRIDFVFDLVARNEGMTPGTDEYATFYHFSRKLMARSDPDLEKEWLAVKRTLMLLEEWFADRRLYHLIGYLIWVGEDVNGLRALAAGNTKQQFRRNLKAKVFQRTFGTTEPEALAKQWVADRLDQLEYGSDSVKIRRILLLFNLATLLGNKQSNMRFQFASFKSADWDIEHVRSVTSDRPGTPRDKMQWLERCLNYLRSGNQAEELRSEIQEFIDLPFKSATDDAFDALYERVLRHFQEDKDGEVDNSISNLVLLDSATNRSYGNAVFAVKRQRILSLDRDGIFVPLCTRNVFLKCYNPQVDHVMFWAEEDRDGYRQAMIETLHGFFTNEWSL